MTPLDEKTGHRARAVVLDVLAVIDAHGVEMTDSQRGRLVLELWRALGVVGDRGDDAT